MEDAIATSALDTYAKLPPKGKPRRRGNGDAEWTVLAGFCLVFPAGESGSQEGRVVCVSLAYAYELTKKGERRLYARAVPRTGLKVLPHNRLPPQGDVLHDSHAEIIARRGLKLFLLEEVSAALEGRESVLRKSDGQWKLRSGVELGMYVSLLPCGDASTYSLSLLAPPMSFPEGESSSTPSTISATALGLHTSRTSPASATSLVHRGRIDYESTSALRTKPGRLDSPPTTSHSCSDKIALWNLVGVQGGLLSSLGFEAIRIGLLVVGGIEASQRGRVEQEVRRAVAGRVGVAGPKVEFTDKLFDGDRKASSDASCPESLSFVRGLGTEVIVNGIRQGCSSKRKGDNPFGPKSRFVIHSCVWETLLTRSPPRRSRLCKLSLFERFEKVRQTITDEIVPLPPAATYFVAKRQALGHSYQEAKSQAQKAGAPLNGWLVSGEAFESFGVDGRLATEAPLHGCSGLTTIRVGQVNGLEKDLGLVGASTSNQYNVSLVVFFVGYVITEIPSNILLKRLRPSRWIPAIMIVWGITMTLMGIVKSYGGLVAARFCLGLAESGLFPGICFYLTMWYKRDEANFRISLFFSAATLAGAFGGLLAFGISKMSGIGGKNGWSWIFIVEGSLTFCVACVSPFVIDDFPEQSRFLSPSEKVFVVQRLKEDQGASGEAPFAWGHLWAAATDWLMYVVLKRVWMYSLIYIGVAEPLYSLSLFIPTIIANLGTFTKPQASLLSTPPFFLAFIITLLSALYSDKIKNRGKFNIFWMLIAVIGFAIELGVNPKTSPGVAYFGLFLCVGAVSPCISNTISWIGVNCGPTYKRACGMGMMFTLGNSGGIVSSFVYFKQDAPRYARGHATGLGFAAMAMVYVESLRTKHGGRNLLHSLQPIDRNDHLKHPRKPTPRYTSWNVDLWRRRTTSFREAFRANDHLGSRWENRRRDNCAGRQGKLIFVYSVLAFAVPDLRASLSQHPGFRYFA
ncbi:hypothetical protein P7C70_g4146, partial [Phenoliferia sp. Uapishka_3]